MLVLADDGVIDVIAVWLVDDCEMMGLLLFPFRRRRLRWLVLVLLLLLLLLMIGSFSLLLSCFPLCL